MKLADFDFYLPEELIALQPVEPRDHSRLLVVDKTTGKWQHRRFDDLPELLSPRDLLVLNNTRVISARLHPLDPKGRKMEVFLVAPSSTPGRWRCLVRPGRWVKESLPVTFSDGNGALITREAVNFDVQFDENIRADFDSWLEKQGKTPLPPYIRREATDQDKTRYQTVYARERGSIAAPTAGLHFTPALLERLPRRVELTLHVGYGTFAPIQVENLDEHRMHEEVFEVPGELIGRLETTRAEGGRVIAVGTTSLRTLESLQPRVTSGATSIFIQPGYRFRFTDGLITNFHLPQSTLFVLICALLGTESAKACYEEAVREKYRFYSYGDAMLIL